MKLRNPHVGYAVTGISVLSMFQGPFVSSCLMAIAHKRRGADESPFTGPVSN